MMMTFSRVMQISWSFSTLIFACIASPTEVTNSESVNPTPDCIPRNIARVLVNDYIYHVAQNYDDQIAQAILANNITVTSQSVNALMGKTASTGLDGPTFQGKAAVIAGETSQPKTLKLTNIDAVDCSTIVFRWYGIPGSPANTPVRATSIFDVMKGENGTWQISQIFGEFNSLTWGEDTGANCTLPPPPS